MTEREPNALGRKWQDKLDAWARENPEAAAAASMRAAKRQEREAAERLMVLQPYPAEPPDAQRKRGAGVINLDLLMRAIVAGLPPRASHVYAIVCWYANRRTRETFIKTKTIAKLTGHQWDKDNRCKTVERATEDLVRYGLIEKLEQRRRTGGEFSSLRIRIL